MVLLIGGHGRSGTTLLRHLCQSHRQMMVTNELNYLSGIGLSYAGHTRQLLSHLRGRVVNNLAFRSGLGNTIRGARFAAHYLWLLRRHAGAVVDAHAVDSALREMVPTARVVGDKMPSYVWLLDRLAGTPGLAFVIIHRDCRDVVTSTLQLVRGEWGRRSWSRAIDSAEKVAAEWVRYVEVMERHRERICIVRYESLVSRPRAELERVATWLGVDPNGFSPSLVESVRDSSLGRHRSYLTAGEQAAVMEFASPAMARLGYS